MEEKKEKLTFKEVWKNKRYRALIILGFYLFFFLFLITGIRNHEPNKPSTPLDSPQSSFEMLNNYEATYVFTIEDAKFHLNVIRYREKEVLETEETGEKYYIEEDHFYQVVEEKLQVKSDKLWNLPYLKLRPDELSKLLKYSTFQHQTDYQNNRNKKTYQISVKGFLSWLDGSFSTNEEMVTIVTEEVNGMMMGIEIDLTHYNGEKIAITYQNHNQISNLETNYQ